MLSVCQNPPNRNLPSTIDHLADRRVAAITRVARECSPRQIASLITKAVAGDQIVLDALVRDAVTIDDLRELLRGQAVTPILEQFRWRGRWTGTEPRLFLLAPTEERALCFMEHEGLDPFRCFAYADPAEIRRDIAINDEAGIETEVIIIGYPS